MEWESDRHPQHHALDYFSEIEGDRLFNFATLMTLIGTEVHDGSGNRPTNTAETPEF
ncbi:MAG: hypothetical protein F6K30_13770 [Cyanothece sp. SIO2G6]|nr:hypothetical protein [Cyanothece sp. SIO2G6]